jgi:hypothetical protein
VLSSTPGNAKPIFRTVSKLTVLLGMASAIIGKNRSLFKTGECEAMALIYWQSQREIPCFRVAQLLQIFPLSKR